MNQRTIDTETVTENLTRTAVSDVDAATEPARLPKDTLFEILKNQRRRDALAYLNQCDGATTLSDMAEHIAAKENGIDVGALSSSQRKRVYIGLYQCHLPKMSSAGIIDFDKNRGTIALRPEAAQLDVYLDDDLPTAAAAETPTLRNLAIAGGLAAGLVASLLGVPGFVLVPDIGWAILSTAVLAVLTALEARHGLSVA